MARNGSGTYVLPAGNPVVTGTVISSAVQNTTMSDIANALTTSIATDGQTPMTANLSLGNNKITNLAPGTLANDAIRLDQAQGLVIQWLPSSTVPTYVSANSFTLAGNQTAEFHPGRHLQFSVTAGVVYGTIATSVFGTLTTVTVLMDLAQVLDAGLNVVNLSIMRSDHVAALTGLVPIRTINITNQSSADFTIIGNDVFDDYLIEGFDLLPANNGATLCLRVSVGGVFQSASTYRSTQLIYNTSAGSAQFTAQSLIALTYPSDGVANTTGFGTSFSASLHGAGAITGVKRVFFNSESLTISSLRTGITGNGSYDVIANAVDGLRIFFDNGNIASGRITLHGLRKAV